MKTPFHVCTCRKSRSCQSQQHLSATGRICSSPFPLTPIPIPIPIPPKRVPFACVTSFAPWWVCFDNRTARTALGVPSEACTTTPTGTSSRSVSRAPRRPPGSPTQWRLNKPSLTVNFVARRAPYVPSLAVFWVLPCAPTSNLSRPFMRGFGMRGAFWRIAPSLVLDPVRVL